MELFRSDKNANQYFIQDRNIETPSRAHSLLSDNIVTSSTTNKAVTEHSCFAQYGVSVLVWCCNQCFLPYGNFGAPSSTFSPISCQFIHYLLATCFGQLVNLIHRLNKNTCSLFTYIWLEAKCHISLVF